jgi:hypothetical protein
MSTRYWIALRIPQMTAAGGAQGSPIMLKNQMPRRRGRDGREEGNPGTTPKENYLNLKLEPSVTSAWISHARRAG